MQYLLLPYKTDRGFWSFETPIEEYPQLKKRTIEENALIHGARDLLDQLQKVYPSGFSILFSNEDLDQNCYDQILELRFFGYDGSSGFNYSYNGSEIWLCSVLSDYYLTPPKTLHIAISPL